MTAEGRLEPVRWEGGTWAREWLPRGAQGPEKVALEGRGLRDCSGKALHLGDLPEELGTGARPAMERGVDVCSQDCRRRPCPRGV